MKMFYPHKINIKKVTKNDSYGKPIVDEILNNQLCLLNYKTETKKDSKGFDAICSGSVRMDIELNLTDLLVVKDKDRKIISIEPKNEMFGNTSHWRVYF
jgi:hypothetical protein